MAEIDKRVKIADKASADTPLDDDSKWVTSKRIRSMVSKDRHRVGDIVYTTYDLSSIDSTYHICDGSIVDAPELYEKIKFSYGFPYTVTGQLDFSTMAANYDTGPLGAYTCRNGDIIFLYSTSSYNGGPLNGFRIKYQTLQIETLVTNVSLNLNTRDYFKDVEHVAEYDGDLYVFIGAYNYDSNPYVSLYRVTSTNIIESTNFNVSGYRTISQKENIIYILTIAKSYIVNKSSNPSNFSSINYSIYGYNMATKAIEYSGSTIIASLGGSNIYRSEIAFCPLSRYIYVKYTYNTSYGGELKNSRSWRVDTANKNITIVNWPSYADDLSSSPARSIDNPDTILYGISGVYKLSSPDSIDASVLEKYSNMNNGFNKYGIIINGNLCIYYNTIITKSVKNAYNIVTDLISQNRIIPSLKYILSMNDFLFCCNLGNNKLMAYKVAYKQNYATLPLPISFYKINTASTNDYKTDLLEFIKISG